MFENRVYRGTADALNELRAASAHLFVTTSKPQALTEKILDHFGLRKLFDGVYGSTLDGKVSNKVELISYIMKQEALPSSQTAMVGERAHDVAGVRENDTFTLGVLRGCGSEEKLLSAGAQVLLRAV